MHIILYKKVIGKSTYPKDNLNPRFLGIHKKHWPLGHNPLHEHNQFELLD